MTSIFPRKMSQRFERNQFTQALTQQCPVRSTLGGAVGRKGNLSTVNILQQDSAHVNRPRTPLAPIRYLVPGTERDQHPRTAAIGYPATGILRSVRTRGGRLYGNDTINFLIAILDQAAADGLTTVEVVITYHRTGVTVTYSTSIEALRTSGQRVIGESGWELALPRQMWSVNGQAPEGLSAAKPAAVAGQPALFDFAEPRRMGAY